MRESTNAKRVARPRASPPGPEEPVVIKTVNNQHTKLGLGMPASPYPAHLPHHSLTCLYCHPNLAATLTCAATLRLCVNLRGPSPCASHLYATITCATSPTCTLCYPKS